MSPLNYLILWPKLCRISLLDLENKVKKKRKEMRIDYLLTVRLKSVSLQAQYDIGRLDFGIINLSESDALSNHDRWHRWCTLTSGEAFLLGTNQHWQISAMRVCIWSIKSADELITSKNKTKWTHDDALMLRLYSALQCELLHQSHTCLKIWYTLHIVCTAFNSALELNLKPEYLS